jgi:predicted porin
MYSASTNAMFATGQTTSYSKDDFWRLGAGLMWKYKDFTLEAAHMWGHHDDPYGASYEDTLGTIVSLAPRSDPSVDTRVWHVGAHYYVYPWLVPFVRLEDLDFINLPDQSVLLLDTEQDRQLLTVGAKMQLRPNIHLNAEFYYYTDVEEVVVNSTIYTVPQTTTYLNDETLMLILRAEF